MRKIKPVSYLLLIVLPACKKEQATPVSTGTQKCATYTGDIASIIENKCAISGCHNAGSHLGDFTTYGEVKERADNGRIRQNVFELKIMPPASAEKLTDAEKEKLQCWLDDGAPQN